MRFFLTGVDGDGEPTVQIVESAGQSRPLTLISPDGRKRWDLREGRGLRDLALSLAVEVLRVPEGDLETPAGAVARLLAGPELELWLQSAPNPSWVGRISERDLERQLAQIGGSRIAHNAHYGRHGFTVLMHALAITASAEPLPKRWRGLLAPRESL